VPKIVQIGMGILKTWAFECSQWSRLILQVKN